MSIHHIKIGSRGSDLALWQAHFVQNEIKTKLNVPCDITIIKTKGDKIQNVSFDKMEGKGFFTKEIEDALLNEDIDLAIHSHKDLPTLMPDGLTVAAVSYREKVNDLLLIHPNAYDKSQYLGMKKGSKLGTSSYRRSSQIEAYRPDVNIVALRGNVPTRLNKLIEGQYDAIILAGAGVGRLNLNLHGMIAIELDPKIFIPAPAQGVLALQCREKDTELIKLLEKLNHNDVKNVISIERTVLRKFDGGCQIALGVYAEKINNLYHCYASWSPDLKSVPYYFVDQSTEKKSLAESCFQKLKSADKTIRNKEIYISKNEDDWILLKNFMNQYNYRYHFKSHIDISYIEFEKSDLQKTKNIILTSKNAVQAISSLSYEELKGLKFFVVSDATAEALKLLGISNISISQKASQSAMSKWLASEYKDTEFLFLAGNLAANYFEVNLKKIKRINVYETKILSLKVSEIEKINSSTDILFSSTSNFKAIENENISWSDKKIYALGEQTAAYINKVTGKEIYILGGQSPNYFISELIKQG